MLEFYTAPLPSCVSPIACSNATHVTCCRCCGRSSCCVVVMWASLYYCVFGRIQSRSPWTLVSDLASCAPTSAFGMLTFSQEGSGSWGNGTKSRGWSKIGRAGRCWGDSKVRCANSTRCRKRGRSHSCDARRAPRSVATSRSSEGLRFVHLPVWRLDSWDRKAVCSACCVCAGEVLNTIIKLLNIFLFMDYLYNIIYVIIESRSLRKEKK